MKITSNSLNGWLFVDKPSGITSNAVLSQLKSMLKVKKMGHTGTLDPFATGFLMIAIGEATKLIPFITHNDKSYIFTIQWGEERDTIDITGKTTKICEFTPSEAEILNVIPAMRGNIMQEPPQFSAISVNGNRAFNMARRGIYVPMAPRPVTIYELRLLSHDPVSRTSVCFAKCSKGTYVRAIARDIAKKFNSVAYVKDLRRSAVGRFHIDNTISLAYLKKVLHNASSTNDLPFIHPPHSILDDILVDEITEGECIDLRCGRAVEFSNAWSEGRNICDGDLVAALHSGRLIAVCRRDGAMLRPLRVFNLE